MCALCRRRDEVLGRNCRFLQGKQTDPSMVAKLGYAIRHGRPIIVKVMNYRRSGQPFLNLISLQPICDRDGLYRFMLGTSCEVSDKYTPVSATHAHAPRAHEREATIIGVASHDAHLPLRAGAAWARGLPR
jgi:hypothetical protein